MVHQSYLCLRPKRFDDNQELPHHVHDPHTAVGIEWGSIKFGG